LLRRPLPVGPTGGTDIVKNGFVVRQQSMIRTISSNTALVRNHFAHRVAATFGLTAEPASAARRATSSIWPD